MNNPLDSTSQMHYANQFTGIKKKDEVGSALDSVLVEAGFTPGGGRVGLSLLSVVLSHNVMIL